MIGPRQVIGWVARAKQAADLHTSSFAQLLLANVVSQPGWLDAQKVRIVPMYRERCHALADALDATLGDRIVFHRPAGGMFLWSRFPEITDTTLLLQNAIDQGVAFVPGNAFTIDQRPDANARFSYSTLSTDQLGEAAARLARAVALT
jgi:2-aminoadipate transaminase